MGGRNKARGAPNRQTRKSSNGKSVCFAFALEVQRKVWAIQGTPGALFAPHLRTQSGPKWVWIYGLSMSA